MNVQVRTLQPLHDDQYRQEALACRRWNAKGVIVAHHDSHGLCYEVEHEDGTIGCYDPDELELVGGKTLNELSNEQLYKRGKYLRRSLAAIKEELEARKRACAKKGHVMKKYGSDSAYDYSQCTECFVRVRTEQETGRFVDEEDMWL